MSNFGKIKIGEPQLELNVHANFQTFGNSFMTLFRCSTGEQWDGIMSDLAREYSPRYQCREEETYESIQANGGEPFECGSSFNAYLFFILFQVICKQIFLNLFIAIIIDAFLGHAETFSLPIQQFEINEFMRIWSYYDPDATGFIKLEDLEGLIVDLANSDEGQGLIVLRELIMKDEKAR